MTPDYGRPHLSKRLLWCDKCQRDVEELHTQGMFVGGEPIATPQQAAQMGFKMIDMPESSVAATAFCHGQSVDLLITFTQLRQFTADNKPLSVFQENGLPYHESCPSLSSPSAALPQPSQQPPQPTRPALGAGDF